MKLSDIPAKFPIPFAADAVVPYSAPIPEAPPGTPGRASLQRGFPPENFIQISAGGTPPYGEDVNGLENQVSAWCRWVGAGGPIYYDAAWSALANGYPNGAFVQSAETPLLFYISIADDNTTDPDSAASANWLKFPPQAFLTVNKTYYVNGTTGSDTLYDGTSSTVSGSHGPFATIQHAVNQVALFNLNGYNVTIYVADGAYAGTQLVPINGAGIVYILGNLTTPASCTVTDTSAAYSGQGAFYGAGTLGNYIIGGFKVSSTNNNGFSFSGGGTLVDYYNVDFGACGFAHAFIATNAVLARLSLGISSPFTSISGSTGVGFAHMYTSGGGSVQVDGGAGHALSISAPVNISNFVLALGLSFITAIYSSITGSANVTGKKFDVEQNSLISVNGAGVGYLPGTLAGTTTSGGQYV